MQRSKLHNSMCTSNFECLVSTEISIQSLRVTPIKQTTPQLRLFLRAGEHLDPCTF